MCPVYTLTKEGSGEVLAGRNRPPCSPPLARGDESETTFLETALASSRIWVGQCRRRFRSLQRAMSGSRQAMGGFGEGETPVKRGERERTSSIAETGMVAHREQSRGAACITNPFAVERDPCLARAAQRLGFGIISDGANAISRRAYPREPLLFRESTTVFRNGQGLVADDSGALCRCRSGCLKF